MGYAVLHSEKGSINSGGIGNHIDRKQGKEHSYPHADPERTHLNLSVKLHENRQRMPLHQAIDERIKEGYKGNRAIRKDAVKYTTHIFTGSHEDMKAIFEDKAKSHQWIKENLDFAKREFGDKNIVRFTVHLDEKTPHIHCVTVPITEDGRLSAKEQFGNRKDMQKRQDRYAEAMEPFGLQRGIRNTGIRHENAREYYTRMKESIDLGNDTGDLNAKRKALGIDIGIDKAKTIENLQSALKTLKTAKINAEKENEVLDKRLQEVKKTAEVHKNNFEKVVNSESTFKDIRDKRLKEAQNIVLKEVKRSVDYRFNLHKLTQEERAKLAFTLANESIKNKVHIKGDLLKSLVTDNKFKYKLVQEVEKRAEENLNRGRERNRGQGLGM